MSLPSSSMHQVKQEFNDTGDIVCEICDDGGEVLLCEGMCMRAFHPTLQSGIHSHCQSLGYNDAFEYEALEKFLCPNCANKMHQCFVCRQLGSSDLSSQPKVFACSASNCGRYYHPLCVGDRLYPSNFRTALRLALDIANGTTFTCPFHKCVKCFGIENPSDPAMQFAICRRCPVSYHRKCLPSEISTVHNGQHNVEQRAWEGLLAGRILIYCMKHDIHSDLQTPSRDHLSFPHVDPKTVNEGCSTHLLFGKTTAPYGTLENNHNRLQGVDHSTASTPANDTQMPDTSTKDKHIKSEPSDTH